MEPKKPNDWLTSSTVVAAFGAAVAGAGAAVSLVFTKHQSSVSEAINLTEIVPIATALITTIIVLVASVVGFLRLDKVDRSTGLARINIGDLARIRSEIASAKTVGTIPFEIEQLASYYSLTLGQARISFWFSLIFAAIGFLVIVGGAALYTEGGITAASIKILSGIIIDGVSALFFIQSRRAQESMSAFFEKLRNDRQFAEARKICEELSEASIKDHLKTILVLHYSGLDSKSMIDALPPRMTEAVVKNS